MTVQVPDQQDANQIAERQFLITMAIIFMLVLGIMMFVFSLAYIKDLQTLRDIPDMIWSFACGQPVENGITLPLLITLSIVSFLGSAILLGVKRWIL